MDDSGKIMLDEAMQQTIAFHESVHILQQQIYGESVNAFLDQGVKMASGDSRNGAYSVTEEMFDKAQSVHAFQEHWEQQAELLEQGFRMVWARRTVNGGSGEEYPGEGSSIVVAGSVIRLTPERWNKLILFMRQFGQASSGALGTTGGALTVQKVKPLRVP